MSLTILALILTVFMGGVIAYNGDLIGRKYGKRRLSLFGMRPKHTAILITSVTGTIISLLTTVVLFLVMPPVREVILRGEEALRKNDELRILNARTERETRVVRATADRLEQQKQLLEREVHQWRRRLDSEMQQARVRIAAEQRKLTPADAQRRRVSAEVIRQRTRLDRLEARAAGLAKSNQDLTRQNADLAEDTVRLTRDKEALEGQNATLTRRVTDLREAGARLAAENAQLETLNADRQRQNDAVMRVNQSLIAESNILNAEKEKARAEKAELERSVSGAFGSLIGMYRAVRARRVTYRVGEELSRTVLPTGAAPDAVRVSLRNLMQSAHLAALARGAGMGDHARAVEIVDKQFYNTASADFAGVAVSENDRLEALVSRLAWAKEPVCVVALAVANSVAGEPASIDFQPLPNRLIYRKGQVVATRRIGNSAPTTRVFNDMVEFLRALGKTALDRGMIPTVDPDTGEPQVGALSAAEIAELVEQVRQTGPRVSLTAVAGSDVSSADRLVLAFRVAPLL